MQILQGPGIADLLFKLFRPHQAEGDPEPDFLCSIIAIGRKLKDAIARLVAADNVLFGANAKLDSAIQRREEKTSTLGLQVGGLRRACTSLFVDLPVHDLGFDRRTAQDPVPLLIQADRVVETLRNDRITAADHLFADDDFDPKKYANQIETSAEALRQTLDGVADAQRHADEVMLDKREVTEEYDNLFLHGARTFESYCQMVGKKELARRVRPSEKRRGRTEVEPDEVPDSAVEGPAVAAGTENA